MTTDALDVTETLLETSLEVGALAQALAKAQAEIKGATKDSDNPFFKSKYADLESVWEACRTALTNHGIAVIQAPTAKANTLSVTTMLLHSSGQWARSTLSTQMKELGPQPVGSATTYLRRYGLSAMAGVAPKDDDDGNAAQGLAGQGPQGRGARREALQAETRRQNADSGPYAQREVDTTTGEVKDVPFVPASFTELMARRAKLPEDVRGLVPQSEDLINFPPKDLTGLIPSYLEAIAETVTRRKLAPKERGDLKEQFFGSRTANLDAKTHNPFFIYALFKHMRTDQP